MSAYFDKALITAKLSVIVFTLFFVLALVSFERVSFLKRFASLMVYLVEYNLRDMRRIIRTIPNYTIINRRVRKSPLYRIKFIIFFDNIKFI